jgi:3'-phosphoadenosine 5'-phosphosulfate sulfotransferase (PAPS reductase)/FAD synthetase
MSRTLSHLEELEAESIQILREVVAEFSRPVMLYSIGKDSSVMLRLAQKAFYPVRPPFPLLHIDTSYKFREMIEFRDRVAAELGLRLIVHSATRSLKGESIRVFPLSNWTEIDIWEYIRAENIPVVPLYFAREQPMLVRGDSLISPEHNPPMAPGEKPVPVVSRMRSLGCTYCTGAVRSKASNIGEIIDELLLAKKSERENRVIDHDQEGSMEQKKREGYF